MISASLDPRCARTGRRGAAALVPAVELGRGQAVCLVGQPGRTLRGCDRGIGIRGGDALRLLQPERRLGGAGACLAPTPCRRVVM